jgi:hypothetical protein
MELYKFVARGPALNCACRMTIVPTGTWGWQRFAMGLAGGEHWYRAMIESGAATYESW